MECDAEPSYLTRGAFSLNEWLVEPDLNRVRRHDSSVHLEPKCMEVLVHLAIHAPDVVPRRLLVDEVWNGSFIADNTLTHAVAELRRAFGDDPVHPTYIETIHRRGYRLLEPVVFLGDPSSGSSVSSQFSLRIVDRIVALREGANLIGRLPGAVLKLPSPQISRRHARITVYSDQAVLDDLDSKNGTRLNGHIVVRPEPLHHGDHIVLGDGVVLIQVVGPTSSDAVPTDEDDTPTDPAFDA